VLAAVDPSLLVTPETPFVALHSAIALAGAGDARALRALRAHCAVAPDATLRTVVVTVCDALDAALDGRWAVAADLLTEVLPRLVRVGGSAAQREVIEDSLLFFLVNDGQLAAAAAVLDARLDRRPSPLDRRRLVAARASSPAGPRPLEVRR
jgi:hypothetical protein